MTCTTIERPLAFQRAEDTAAGWLEEGIDTTGWMTALGGSTLRINRAGSLEASR